MVGPHGASSSPAAWHTSWKGSAEGTDSVEAGEVGLEEQGPAAPGRGGLWLNEVAPAFSPMWHFLQGGNP